MRVAPICPVCEKPAQLAHSPYGVKHKCCGLWSWDGKPLVDAATHIARREAHEVFDRLWKGGTLSRGKAYKLLREELGLTEPECHMAKMDAATAQRVPTAVYAIRERLGREQRQTPSA